MATAASRQRFIPACAGNSGFTQCSRPRPAVHPRVCGEQVVVAVPGPRYAGSSPRVRGTDQVRGLRLQQRRFIPACAGNSSVAVRPTAVVPVHPRVCGEQINSLFSDSMDCGSSPRVRGTGAGVFATQRPRRFIPACAGNRAILGFWCQRRTVHPRVCGEQWIKCFPACVAVGSSPRVRGTAVNTPVFFRAAGSSPRVRGTADVLESRHFALRFIPACAGNSHLRALVFLHVAVHPRVCGEQKDDHLAPGTGDGSSPRVRGTDQSIRSGVTVTRFIPACAGNRPDGRIRCNCNTVHPRVCGEQMLIPFLSRVPTGSSPRVRGTGAPESSIAACHRFIPACAGNRHFSCRCASAGPGSSPRVRGTAPRDAGVIPTSA